jgi:hypothetical protein
MGKTGTIKQRAIYVYLPSQQMTERWKQLAEKQGTSISKFVAEHVENSLRQEHEPGYRSRSEMSNDIQELKAELEEERKRSRRLDLVVERLEEELRRYRAQPFLEKDFQGVRGFNRQLVEILRAGGVLTNEDLLARLGVAHSEHEAIKSISKQLEILESYGLVKSTPRGWRWNQ